MKTAGERSNVLTTALPLWLLAEPAAPRWSVSLVMLVNTVLVVVFQVRASRSVDTPRAGGRAFSRAGFALLVACVLFSALAALPAWCVLPLLVAIGPALLITACVEWGPMGSRRALRSRAVWWSGSRR